MLYGACCRIAKDMGYRKFITYILQSELGTSLKASGFVCDGEAEGTHWTGERNRGQEIPAEMKTRWYRLLA
nr:XF1762 family protein [Enterocloster bolteae]